MSNRYTQPMIGRRYASHLQVIRNEQLNLKAAAELAAEMDDPDSRHWVEAVVLYRLLLKNEGHADHPALFADYENAQAEAEAVRAALVEIL